MKIWLPTLRAGTGTDIYAERLATGLTKRGMAATITWLNHYYELFPFLLKKYNVPDSVDIIHANSINGFIFHRPGVKLIVTVHHHNHDVRNNLYKSIPQRFYQAHVLYRYEALSFAVADRVTAVSNASSGHISRAFNGVMPAVIYNGIDADFFCPGAYAGKKDKFRLLFVGKPSAGKGFDLLGPIMESLGNDFVLYYTGSSGVHEKMLSKNAINVGRLDRNALLAMYRECNALLFPTRYEGFGYTVCEAMACGKPVITSDNTSLPELVQDKDTGILCKTNDVNAFADAARLLAGNPDLARRMGEAGRQRVLQNFTLEKMTDSYIRLYEEVLSA